ncbi:MAG TPA: hypothetical protein VGR94_06815 [Candidatus Acidoferrales bacterium]|nr:hypothetical protein [Candidatus Acidoferrales bacterium]HEV2499668.1 hypothetical protein [Terriglobia bacterium]
MNWKHKAMAILGTSFIFVLCGSQVAYAAPPTDACSLLTAAQVNAVLGVPAAGKSFGPNLCIWVQTGVKPGSPRRRVNVGILIMQGYTQGYAVAKMPNAPTTETHVSGLGDDAYYLSMTSGKAMELRVKKGSVAFGIRVQRNGTPFTPDQIKAKEKTLAQDVLAKL